mgnify:FL=1|tara:strand:+ start:719 stop:1045 length:327 start_codon:yes stop_codon:yes gene_type:complete
MANEKNTVNYRDGNQPEDLTACCGEQPRQGWSFMGSFIWCNQCGEKMHSSTLNQWELGEKWNDEHTETPEAETVICRQCNGTGKTRFSPRSITEIKARCSSCNGTGEI